MGINNSKEKDKNLTIVGHLQELRTAILISLSAIIICTIIVYSFSKDILKAGIKGIPYLVFYNPGEGFAVHLELSFIFGFIFALPITIGEIWNFISPGLYRKERKYSIVFISITIGCFAIGTWTAYNYIIPILVKNIILSSPSWLKPFISANEYIRSFFMTCIVIGLFFEILPLSFFLAYFKIFNYKQMKQHRKTAYIIFILLNMNFVGIDDWVRLFVLWIFFGIIYEIIRVFIKIFSFLIPYKINSEYLAG